MLLNNRKKIIMGVIGHDIHSVSNILIEQALKKEDFDVLNLGVDIQPYYFRDSIIEFGADALLISSLNGEWKYWIPKLTHCLKPLKTKPILYLGGNILSLNNKESKKELSKLKTFGIERVFDKEQNFNNFLSYLNKDLHHNVL